MALGSSPTSPRIGLATTGAAAGAIFFESSTARRLPRPTRSCSPSSSAKANGEATLHKHLESIVEVVPQLFAIGSYHINTNLGTCSCPYRRGCAASAPPSSAIQWSSATTTKDDVRPWASPVPLAGRLRWSRAHAVAARTSSFNIEQGQEMSIYMGAEDPAPAGSKRPRIPKRHFPEDEPPRPLPARRLAGTWGAHRNRWGSLYLQSRS